MAAVRDIMTSDVKTASPDNTLQDVARMMRDADVGAIPVVDDDDLRGIITDRDIVVRCVVEGMDPTDTTVGDILSTDLQTIEPDADISDAAQMMAENQIRRLPVVEDGTLIGIITLGDLAVQPGEEEQAGQTLEDVSQGAKGGQQSARGRQSQSGRQSRSSAQSKQRSSRSQNAKSGRMQVVSGGTSRGEGRQASSRRSTQTASRSSSRRGNSGQRRAS